MALEQEFIDAFTSKILVELYLGEDTHGNNTYDESFDACCRVDGYTTSRGSLDQAEQLRGASVVTTSLIMACDPILKPRDRITMENTKIVYVTDATVVYDEDGPHHQTIEATEREIS